MSIAEFGDTFEVETGIGLAYLQYTHRHEEFGELIRALPGIFDSRPNDLSWIAHCASLFKLFYPLSAAMRRGLVEKIGNYPIPAAEAAFPLFRVSGLPDPRTMQVVNWSVWDGTTQTPIGKIRRKYRRLPIREIVNHSMLVHRLETQWRPEEWLGEYAPPVGKSFTG